MLDILYVVRALPVKQSKGVQISLSTPNLMALSSTNEIGFWILNPENSVQLRVRLPIYNGLFEHQLVR